MIITRRLTLIPATIALLQAELEATGGMASLLAAHIPQSWPPLYFDSDAVRFALRVLETSPGTEDWWFHYFVLRDLEGGVLIGAGGFKGPRVDGMVEIGYSIIPEYQRRGLASEAASGLVAHAFSHAEIDRVRGETYPELEASIAVLRKCRFEFVGAGSEPGVIRFEVTRRAWLGLPELSAT